MTPIIIITVIITILFNLYFFITNKRISVTSIYYPTTSVNIIGLNKNDLDNIEIKLFSGDSIYKVYSGTFIENEKTLYLKTPVSAILVSAYPSKRTFVLEVGNEKYPFVGDIFYSIVPFEMKFEPTFENESILLLEKENVYTNKNNEPFIFKAKITPEKIPLLQETNRITVIKKLNE